MPELSNAKWDSDGAPFKKKSRTDAETSNMRTTSADSVRVLRRYKSEISRWGGVEDEKTMCEEQEDL